MNRHLTDEYNFPGCRPKLIIKGNYFNGAEIIASFYHDNIARAIFECLV